ncbi:hypothetical protein CPB86DRAFT_799894 [Serendipita vermifera]|nr:hypothetical protein CPB86DRAFT_799894 [Serendipita vermifera]
MSTIYYAQNPLYVPTSSYVPSHAASYSQGNIWPSPKSTPESAIIPLPSSVEGHYDPPVSHHSAPPSVAVPPPSIIPLAAGTPAYLPGVIHSTFTPTYASATVVPSVPVMAKEDEPKDEPETHVLPREKGKGKMKVTRRELIKKTCCGSCYTKCTCELESEQPIAIHCYCELEPVQRVEEARHRRHRRRYEVEDDRSESYSEYYYPSSMYESSSSRQKESRYPRDIYDAHYDPTAIVRPVIVKKEEPWIQSRVAGVLHLSKGTRKDKLTKVDDWVRQAIEQRPINAVQARNLFVDGVEIHPLLDKATQSVFFNILEPKSFITLSDSRPLSSIEAHPATSPRLIKMELYFYYSSTPIVLINTSGVTVGQVIDAILSTMHKLVMNRDVREWSRERRGIIYQWYWHNRDRIRGLNRHLVVGDTFAGNNDFAGLQTVQRARKEDERAMAFPSHGIMVCLNMDCMIPGLRHISEFPV